MKTAICVIIKDEHDYLKEWIDHHLNLGIDEIYLYEDYNSKSHSAITEPYGDKVHLQSIDTIFKENEKNFSQKDIKSGSFFQHKLFQWFPIEFKNVFDWVLFIDIDEFLILKEPLQSFLEEYKDESAIYIKWKFYGANGHIKKPQGKVVDNYTKPIPTSFDYGINYKSFVNLKKYTYWCNPIHGVEGGKYPITSYGDHKGFINHYFTKSWEEWKWKIFSRGDAFPGHRKINEFFILNPELKESKNSFMLEIAIENAAKLGFNQHLSTDINLSNKRYLHFCWFGGGKFNQMNKMCIESWKQYLSNDFIVCLWDEKSFEYNAIPFTKEAYDAKAWAFVVDYVRLWAIYTFGGIYLDTDVELLKPIDNLPLNFLAIEKDYDSIAMGLGFGSKKGNYLIQNLLSTYDTMHFNNNEKCNITSPKITSNFFYQQGYELNLNEVHEYLGFTIYPPNYFCPKSHVTQELTLTDDTISIHHYHASWVDKTNN